MRDLPNLEPSAFRRGEYVAHGRRVGWYRVRRRPNARGWYACRYVDKLDVCEGMIFARTLAEIAAKVAAVPA